MLIKFTPKELKDADEEVQGIMRLMDQTGFPLPRHGLYEELMTIVLQNYMTQIIERFQFK